MVEIRIDGPGKNALGSDLIRSLSQQISAAEGAPIMFTGTGDAFSAGLNLKEVASLNVDTMADFLERLENFFRLIWLYPGPTAAAVNGHAIAGGCIMAMCCDYAVATDNPKARIGLNEVAIGLRFPPGILNFVRASISPQHINEVVLGAGLHSPENAARLGLVQAVSSDPIADARVRLEKLSKHPAQAYQATKYDLRTGILEASAEQQDAFREQVVPFWTSPEIKALIRSLLGN
jgi:enoyl-CoA hydratase